MVTPKSCFSVQLHLSCNTCTCFAVAFSIRCTLRIRNVDVESSSLIHLLPLIGSLFPLPSTVCVLHSLLTADAACALWWFSVLSHCNFKWQTFALSSLSLPLTLPLSLSPTVYFLCKMQKITFIFLGIGLQAAKPARKTFCRCPSEKCNSTPDRPRPPPPPPWSTLSAHDSVVDPVSLSSSLPLSLVQYSYAMRKFLI